MTTVYKPSTKALRKNVMQDDFRIILLPKIIETLFPYYGLALVYQNVNVVIDGKSVVAPMLNQICPYRGKDSHLRLAKEELPSELYVTMHQAYNIANHGIELPFKTLKIISDDPNETKN